MKRITTTPVSTKKTTTSSPKLREFSWSGETWDKSGNKIIEKIGGCFFAIDYEAAHKKVRGYLKSGRLTLLYAVDETVRIF